MNPEIQKVCIGKPQMIRLWDMFFLAPMMIYLGTRRSNLPALAKTGLVITGALTFLYNGRNYLIQRKLSAGENDRLLRPALTSTRVDIN